MSNRPLAPILISPLAEPKTCIEVNDAWIPFLVGVLRPYRYPEQWTGNVTDNRQARVYAQVLLDIVAESLGCDEMTNICCDDIQRKYQINAETGVIDVSQDNGETWNEAPGTIYSDAVAPAPLPGADGNVKRCEAANNCVDNLKDVKAGIASKLGITYTLFDFAVAILVEILILVLTGLSGGATALLVVPLIPKIIETARAIFGLSAEDYEALFTETVWTTTRCILYCHVGANGKFNAAGWSSVKSDLKIQLGSGATQAGSNLAAMVDVWALTGLNHAAAFGAGSEGNCDDCPCSTCDWSMWEQWVNGVILSQDHSHITIQAVLVSGSWNAGVRNVNIHACCCQVVYGIPEGQHINTSGYIPCDETNDDQTNMSFTYESQSANAFVFQSDTPFTITLTGQALEDCV